MDWLKKLNEETVYNYRNTDTGEILQLTKQEIRNWIELEPTTVPGSEFCVGGVRYEYAGFEPRKLNIMTKITFEKNGRKGLRVKTAQGGQSVRSLSKENYLKGKGTKSVLTKGCTEASNKEKERMVRKKYSEWTKGGSK